MENRDRNVAFAHFTLRRRWEIVVATLLVAAACLTGLPRIQFTNAYRYFLEPDNPQLVAFDANQAIYTKDENLLIAIRPSGKDVFTREALAVVRDLTEAMWQTPYSIRVDSLTNFQHTEAEGDDLVVRDLVSEPAALSDEELGEVRRIALSEPLLVHRIVDGEGTTTAVNVNLQLPGKSEQESVEAVDFARERLAELRAAHPDWRFALTGIAPFNLSFTEAAQSDLATLYPVMFAILLVSLGLFLRSVTGVLLTIVIVTLADGIAFGLAGWIGILLTPPSVSSMTVILTVAVADCVHLFVTMRHGLAEGRSKHEAIVESLRVNLQPVFLTSLTTAIGFLSLNLSEVRPFRDFGNITAMGVGAAWLLSVLFLPAAAAILPARAKRLEESESVDPFGMRRLAEWVIAAHRPLLGIMVLTVGIAAVLVTRIELNDQFVEWFDESIPFRADTDFVNENLTGIHQVSFSLPAGESGGVSEPAYLKAVDRFSEWLRGKPEVVHVATITDVMKRLNRNMHGDDSDWHRLPDDRELAAQYLLLYEMSLPYGLDLNNQIDIGKSASRVIATTENLTSRAMREFGAEAEAFLAENEAFPIESDGTAPTMMFAHLSIRSMWSNIEGTVLALVLVSATLVVALRSVRIGLFSLLPNLIPMVLTFGLWSFVVGELSLAGGAVLPASIGIIVDNTVHLLSKYQRARRELAATAEDAVRYAFRTVGPALVVTTLVLAAGFSVLALSAFEVNGSMGLLFTLVIVAALAADFLFLPPLLIVLERRISHATASDPVPAP